MAEIKKPGANRPAKDLKEDEVVARLVPDPSASPDVIAMVGFLGKSSRSGFWRVYTSLDLKDYVEIAEDDVVYTQSLTTELQRLGGTVIWIKSGARVQHSRSESRLAETEFLKGEIMREFLSETGMQGLARIGNNVVFTTNTMYGPGACCSRKILCAIALPASRDCSTE